MTETQRRIKAYKKALPHLKERVTAVALLLAMSLAMMTSASFAWVTLSRSPEVSGLATTVSTNGNLEIALSNIYGTQPDESTVTDGAGTVTQSNLTWGNLINLSDPSYGLSDIVLRPASLNKNELLTSPVYAVQYGTDGRMQGYITDFAYTKYSTALGKYGVTDEFGVRAVSSVTYENISGNQEMYDMVKRIETDYYTPVKTDFANIYGNSTYMKTIGALVQNHANYTLGNGDVDCADHMPTLLAMMKDFKSVVEKIGMTYVEMGNLYYYRSLQDINAYDPFKLADLTSTASARHSALMGYLSELQSVDEYLTLYTTTIEAYNGIDKAAAKAEQGQTVSWASDLRKYADKLCDFETATIEGMTVSYINENAISLVGKILGWDNKVIPASINAGAIKDVDAFLDGAFYVDNQKRDQDIKLDIQAEKAGFEVNITVYPTVQTDVYNNSPSYLYADYTIAKNDAMEGGSNYRGDAVAAETYAMAIDLWVRTNVPNALLILEGDYITRNDPIQAKDAEGNLLYNTDGSQVYLYTYTYTYTEDDDTEKTSKLSVYELNGEWYYEVTHALLSEAVGDTTQGTFEQQWEEVTIGYTGVNRVWNELDDPDSAASSAIAGMGTSTTQGSGSCYVFYPQSAEDQAQCLKLLAAMRIAFVDDRGTLLARAFMDTDNAIEEAGRVIIPLQLYSNTPIEVDADGNTETDYIMPLVQNQATRITALVYLEGLNLGNEDVLSAGSITGQLNLQLGTNEMDMDAMDDNKLMEETYTVSFDQNEFTFGEDDTDYSITLNLNLDGVEPAKVAGNFISVINATQGARQPQFTFKKVADGTYTATVTFSGPGNYQLRSIQIDGVDYALNTDEFVYVTIPGQKVIALTWGDGSSVGSKTVQTAEEFSKQEFSLTLNSAADSIASVRGVFQGEGKTFYVNFTTKNGEDYTGSATFTSSGTYEMTYVYINGTAVPLDTEMQKSVTVKLGLRAEVFLSMPYFDEGVSEDDQNRIVKKAENQESIFVPGVGYNFIYTGEKPIYFDIRCYLYDNEGNPINYLTDMVINYGQDITSGLPETPLTWDSSKGCYTGTFDFQHFGIFEFRNVIIGGSYVTKTVSAHSITAISTDPMEYVPTTLEENVFDLGAPSRDMSIKLKNAPAASLIVTLTNEKGETHVVEGVTAAGGADENGISTFTVQAPKDGKWTITDVQASNVFYKEPGQENGTFYAGGKTADGKLQEGGWLDLTTLPNWQTTGLTTKFITTVDVALVTEKTAYENTNTTIFTTLTIPEGDVKVTFVAYDLRPLAVHAAEMGVTLSASIEDMYYIRSDLDNIKVETLVDDVKVSGAGNITADSPSLVLNVGTFTYTGSYTPDTLECTLTYVVNGETKTKTSTLGGMPTVKLTWDTPTATITKIFPSGSNPAKITYKTKSLGWGRGTEPTFSVVNQTSAITAATNTAVVYALAIADNDTQHHGRFTKPSLTVTIAGVDSNTSVSFVLPKGDAKNDDNPNGLTFSRTGNGDITKSLGTVEQINSWKTNYGLYTHTLSAYYGHNSGSNPQTITTMTIVRNGVTYTVTLDKPIVVNNPSSVNQTS